RRHVGPPGLSQSCVSAIQWHEGKEGSQPEKGMDEMQYIMWRGSGRRHVGPPGLIQSLVSLRSNGMRERKAANQRRTRLRSSI
uniref:ACB domain-containing protein n=1 Tax=Mesocestoides corti TaxID=53468 RepID=A0A5K3FUW3_MESCO